MSHDAMLDDPLKYLRVDPAVAIRDQAKSFDAKKWVWVPVKEDAGYLAAEVKGTNGDLVVVETEDGKVGLYRTQLRIICKPSGKVTKVTSVASKKKVALKRKELPFLTTENSLFFLVI